MAPSSARRARVREKDPFARRLRQARGSLFWVLVSASLLFFASSAGLLPEPLGSDGSFRRLLHRETDPQRRFDLSHVIVCITSTESRLHSELPFTLRSLFKQTLKPREIQVYLPLELQDKLRLTPKSRGRGGKSRFMVQRLSPATNKSEVEASERLLPLPYELQHPLVSVLFVSEQGPSSKLLHVIQALTAQACESSKAQRLRESQECLRTPIVICDDDHYYFPDMLETLVRASWALPSCAAVGIRGWRIRVDLQWGVAGLQEYRRHMIEGHKVGAPYQVGVLTANKGYLIRPAFFLEGSSCATSANRLEGPRDVRQWTGGSWVQGVCSAVPILNSSTSEMDVPDLPKFVDDVWLSGHLARLHVPRFVVPARGKSIDITIKHTLDTKITKSEETRAQALTNALQGFKDQWEKDIWYQFIGANSPAPASLLASLGVLFRSARLHFGLWADYLTWRIIPHSF